ncbi:MAG: DEAD/DEAH box helicase family protein [Candidatus Tectomicrobia bacterium]|nr:DEAD/DEAH box helicase family protein [Candidatus Tectomicrobia bacterium]
MNEATARIRINVLLEKAGWRFFSDASGPANISLEHGVTLRPSDLDALGDDFERTERGQADFLLLGDRGFPLVVLEAKSQSKQPLVGKEQARRYARSLNCRFVLLSNGHFHYFWDLERGNPHIIPAFPTPESVGAFRKAVPNPQRLINETVEDDYIVLTQRPNYGSEAAWLNEAERPGFIRANGLRFLRDYQLRAIHTLQQSVRQGEDRFLFEMATGTGKTLVAAAVIKLFLRTGNASRALFLVDRLELESQAANGAFGPYLSNDFDTVVYKEKRADWRSAHIVVTTVQSLLFNNKYQTLFSPTDFDLVISDEAHRSIGGNARAVFNYFVGYKLGLTATPRNYLRGYSSGGRLAQDPREVERRLLLDTYRTFGCESGQPTFRYSLLDGVKDGHLVNPTVVDARTEVTTQLLADDGFTVSLTDDTGEDHEETFRQREFERRFFAEATNQVFCRTFLENALRDPVSGEIGKSIVFAVSQNHAARLTQTLNAMADVMYPGRYQSDFAVQVSSHVPHAQQFAVNFANNKLMGTGNFLDTYRTSKARVCVTVGMMTTGYDCTDILNIGLFRPIFSPTDFVQIKGRGTRRHTFTGQCLDAAVAESVTNPEKTTFKLFDFFATCEYFETEFNYDQVLKLPSPKGRRDDDDPDPNGNASQVNAYEHLGADILATMSEQPIGPEGMRIDRMMFERFADTVRQDDTVREAVEAGRWDQVIDYVNHELFDKPEEYYTLDKLRKAAAVDRRLTLREILELVFDLIPRFKSRDELLEEEFDKFITQHEEPEPEPQVLAAIKAYFKAYATSGQFRHVIDTREFAALSTNPAFSMADLRQVPQAYRGSVPEYIKDYVSLNQFAA